MNTLYFITSNKGKLVELQERVHGLPITIRQHDLGYPEIQADCLEDVARFGIEWIQQRFPDHCFILEDSGLFIDSLHGFPGPYSKYVFYTIGLSGILTILSKRKQDERTAVFRSVIGYYSPNEKPIFIVGECPGIISTKIQGTNGFGYDPIFIPKGKTKTFGQMTTTEKNQCSHRGKATDQLFKILEKRKRK